MVNFYIYIFFFWRGDVVRSSLICGRLTEVDIARAENLSRRWYLLNHYPPEMWQKSKDFGHKRVFIETALSAMLYT